MTTRHYSAPWGARIKWITAVMLLLGIAPVLVSPWLIHRDPRLAHNPTPLWLACGVVGIIVAGTSLWSIRGFEIDRKSIVVRRVFWVNRIPVDSVVSAEADPKACRGAWKRMGNDGLFAMHGRFQSKHLGRFQAYVTDPANSVVLHTATDVVVISPDDPRKFVRDLHRLLERREGNR